MTESLQKGARDSSNHRITVLEKYHPEFERQIEDYLPFISQARVDEIRRLSDPLIGKSWTNVNSTFMGGGVAEMLQSIIPPVRKLGIDADWYVIQGNQRFFQVTKKLHNLLQGVEQEISMEEIFGAYLDTIDENSKKAYITSDMVVIHDPQPAAMIINGVLFGNILWRCHIDTSNPNPLIWRFLLPYINLCSGAIFTMPEYVGPGLQIPIYQITPCIDPLIEKNTRFSKEKALDILHPLFEKHRIDPHRPILAAISRYDVHKNQLTTLKAFNLLRRRKKFDPPPYLIFLGNTATDDPEGDAMLEKLKEKAGDDPDVHFWVNVDNNDQVVGALMHIARVFIHISTREGFGLVVTEAMWQGTPVIGSRAGGIIKQVLDGQTGYLVDAIDVEAVAEKMAFILERPDDSIQMGANAREHIREHFLLPELLKRYLVLMRFYTGVDRLLPGFRLDDLSYSEIMHAMRVKHPYLEGNQRFSM